MKKHRMLRISLLTSLLAAAAAQAGEVTMQLLDDKGVSQPVGSIRYESTPYGVVFTPQLKDLPPGIHGFHLHQNPDCSASEQNGKRVPGGAAGGHFDPAGTGRHEGPWGNGHLGDLPALYVDTQGHADYPVLAPRLKLSDLNGHSLMIHLGGDNHADHPAALGGGGARIACGVIAP